MLAVISDLHFEEEASDTVRGTEGTPVRHRRNLGPRAFERFFDALARQTVRDGASELHLILAGDVFDLHRTAMWFSGSAGPAPVRPYVASSVVGGTLEQRLLQILDAIAAEGVPEAGGGGAPGSVAGSLAAIRRLAAGRYLVAEGGRTREEEFPAPVRITYIPGNHDRLANATPALRRRVRELLGLPGGPDPFPHQVFCAEERALVRHGHEYDRYNFSRDFAGRRRLPELDETVYGAPAFGDFVTVEIASRLPVLFRELHGESAIVARPVLRRLYLRLLEFDDLRPQGALLEFLLAGAAGMGGERRAWKAIEPVLRRLLEEIHDHPYLRRWLKKLEKKWSPDAIDALQAALDLAVWRAGVPLSWVRALMRLRGKVAGGGVPPEEMAAREPLLGTGDARFVIAGHTHHPQVALLSRRHGVERYYIDTGTWRNRIPANRELTTFGRLKALTSVVLFGPDEDPDRDAAGPKSLSFDYWTGFTQRWRG